MRTLNSPFSTSPSTPATSGLPTPRRSHRQNIAFFHHASFEQERTIRCQHFSNSFLQFFTSENTLGRNIISRGHFHIIRIQHRGKRIATVEKHSLPLTYVSEIIIVQADNLHRSLLLHNRTQFLNIHLQSAISHKYAYGTFRCSESCPQ